MMYSVISLYKSYYRATIISRNSSFGFAKFIAQHLNHFLFLTFVKTQIVIRNIRYIFV